MTRNRRLSQLGSFVGINTTTNTVSFGSSTSPSLSVKNGLMDSNNGIGSTGYILTSIGAGVSWSLPSNSQQSLQGIQGIQGRQGTTGTGIQGIQGPAGSSGVGTGGSGSQGIQGIQGTSGSVGVQGLTGSSGIGSQGIPGIQGVQGPAGPSGVGTGGSGSQGIQGIQGTTGPIAGSANQVIYKNSSNVATGSSGFIFDGESLIVNQIYVDGSVRSTSGFASIGSSSTVQIDVVGNTIRFSVAGIGTATLNLV